MMGTSFFLIVPMAVSWLCDWAMVLEAVTKGEGERAYETSLPYFLQPQVNLQLSQNEDFDF